MPKEAMIRARIEPKLKQGAEKVFARLGLSATDAITLFYTQVLERADLPFRTEIPNETTLQAFRDTERGENMIVCENAEDMFKKLGI
jgi:DNA-damage-inducible protein J